VSDETRRLTTAERERVYTAKEQGGLCAACGRGLSSDDSVYIARFWVGMKLFGDPEKLGSRVFAEAPVGVECVSPVFRGETERRDPDLCVGCGRRVYYQAPRASRHRALCSTRCGRHTTTGTTGVAG
jgi:hypothetical protein